jgi:ABC-type branched-subunit amino acid transport system ATPase component
VFPSLTVAENRGSPGWLDKDRRSRADAIVNVLEMFPVLTDGA